MAGLYNLALGTSNLLRFGPFDLLPSAGELRKHGEPVHLPPQAFKVLVALAARSGEVVTRDELRAEVWRGETYVDFDQGLNFCIRQIRAALGDEADAPQYIETLPRRGYRFLTPVDAPAAQPPPASLTRLIVLPFRMLRADPETDFLAFSLPDAITTALSGLEALVMRSSLAAGRFANQPLDPRQLATDADVDVVLSGSLARVGDQLRVSTQLTEVPAGTLLWSRTWDVALGNLFRVEDELATRVVEALALPLTAREQGRLGRDVPASAQAYEWYLRGNQLSQDPKQWTTARDLYLRCVKEDPRYAPAWARLGRLYHVMGKYLESGAPESLDQAEFTFRRALEINPDLPLAHKLYAQLEVDRGRALDAMVRLLGRARSADPDVFAGLVSACRYCGLLDASIAADARARRFEPRIRTSVAHTWFVRGEYEPLAATKLDDIPYVGALGALGRSAEAVARLTELEERTRTRLRDFMIAARTLLEGRRDESLAAVNRIVASNFGDPEGLFYLARHLARLGERAAALQVFHRVVDGGYCCYPAMAQDAWLEPLVGVTEFASLVERVRARHNEAAAAFVRLQGELLLGLVRRPQPAPPTPLDRKPSQGRARR